MQNENLLLQKLGLVYPEQSITSQYTHEITWDLDFSRAWDSNPECWRVNKSQTTFANKTMIIADPSLFSFIESVDSHNNNPPKLFLFFKEKDFEKHVWEEQGLIKIDDEKIFTYHIPFTAPQHIIDTAIKQGLAAEKIEVIHYFKTRRLLALLYPNDIGWQESKYCNMIYMRDVANLNEKALKEFLLFLSEFDDFGIQIDDKIGLKNCLIILDWLQKNNKKIVSIIIDAEINEEVHSRLQKFYVSNLKHFKSTIFNQDLFYITTNCPELEKLKISDGLGINLDRFAEVTAIEYAINHVFPKLVKLKDLALELMDSPVWLEDLLTNTFNLEEVSLVFTHQSKELCLASNLRWPLLRHIEIGGKKIDAKDIIPFISDNVIETLDLDGCCDFENLDFLSNLQQPKLLKKLSLIDKEMTADDIASLSRFPNLEHLNLSISDDARELNLSFQLVNIKEFKLETCGLDSKDLANFLACFPNLVALELTECDNAEEDLIFNSSFKALKQLKINNSAISGSGLISLLLYCPNIERLELTGCANIKKLSTPSSFSLPHLKKLSIKSGMEEDREFNKEDFEKFIQCNIDPKTLANFILTCSGLITLEVDGNGAFLNKNLFQTAKFPKLENIYINNIGNKDQPLPALSGLLSLLRGSPKVNKVKLLFFSIEENIFDLEKINFHYGVKVFNLKNIIIEAENLDWLLTQFPDLKELTLHSIYSLEYELEFPKTRGNFLRLKKLDIDNSFLNLQGLKNLLSDEACLTLEELSIASCENLVESSLHWLVERRFPLLKDLAWECDNTQILDRQELSFKDFLKLLSNLPLLQKITFLNCKLSEFFIAKQPINLPNLYKIVAINTLPAMSFKSLFIPNIRVLHGLYFNGSEAMEFIKNHPMLESINIAKYNSSEEDFLLKNYSKDLIQFNEQGKTNTQENDKTLRLDDDTECNSVEDLSVTEYFLPKANGYPEPDVYQENIYNQLTYQGNQYYLVSDLSDVEEIEFQNCSGLFNIYHEQYQDTPDCFFGQKTGVLLNDEILFLPRLSACDELLFLESNVNVKLHRWAIDKLGKETKNYQYYVSLKDKVSYSQKVEINYLIKPQLKNIDELISGISINKNYLEMFQKCKMIFGRWMVVGFYQGYYNMFMELSLLERIAHLVYFFREEFTRGKLNIPENSDDITIVNAIIAEKKGRCEQRTLAFSGLASLFHIEWFAFSNGCHAAGQILFNNIWYTADLGGYPANLVVQHINEPSSAERPIPSFMLPEPQAELAVLPPLNPNNRFITWDHTALKESDNFSEYFSRLDQEVQVYLPDKHNLLITLDSAEEIGQFYFAANLYANTVKRKSFCIDDLTNIQFKTKIIRNGEQEKVITPITYFLETAQAGDILIINCQSWRVSDNAILGDGRNIENHPIPEGVRVILLVEKDLVEEMEDVFSWISVVSHCPSNLLKPIELEEELTGELPSIDLFYDTTNWKGNVVGQYHPTSSGIKFEKGALIKALEDNLMGIEIINAPDESREFRLFRDEVNLKRKVFCDGEWYQLPTHFSIRYLTKEYTWENLSKVAIFNFSDKSPRCDFELNRATYIYYFKNYHCENLSLQETRGFLEMFAKQNINILVTDSFSEGEWKRLFNQAEKYHCQITLVCVDQQAFPEKMLKHVNWQLTPRVITPIQIQSNTFPVPIPEKRQAVFIASNDIDFTAALLAEQIDEVISVNNKTPYGDLFENIIFPEFKFELGYLVHLLSLGKRVLIKGELSENILKHLGTLFLDNPYLWINGSLWSCQKSFPEQECMLKGHLIIIASTTSLRPSFASIFEHEISALDYQLFLAKKFGELPVKQLIQSSIQLKKNFTYIQLETMLKDMLIAPNKNPFKPYILLDKDWKNLYQDIKKVYPLTKKESKKTDDNFDSRRFEKLKNHLDRKPYAFVVGSSAAGKSSFILDKLKDFYAKMGIQITIYEGMEKLAQCIQDTEVPGLRFLVVDEANTERDGAYEQFENLFVSDIKEGAEPFILINDKPWPAKNVRVIFIGNFTTFEGRHEHQFFQRHGLVIYFKDFPESYLKNKIIKPLLEEILSACKEKSVENKIDIISNIFFNSYRYIGDKVSKPIITIRNLQMMCWRLAFLLLHPIPKFIFHGVNSADLACFAVYDEAKHFFNETALDVFAGELFKNHFVSKGLFWYEKELEKYLVSPISNENYLLTDSQKSILRMIIIHLEMRLMLLRNPNWKKYGISGLLLEGSSGIGKSTLPVEYFKSHGYFSTDKDKVNPLVPSYFKFSHLTLMDTFSKEKLANAGTMIIDEMNTRNTESSMNALRGGVGNVPLFIGTQNPPGKHKKRKTLSDAQTNRFYKIPVSEWPTAELKEILLHLGLPEKAAESLLQEYKAAEVYAKTKHKKPVPTPRVLFREAKKLKRQAANEGGQELKRAKKN